VKILTFVQSIHDEKSDNY